MSRYQIPCRDAHLIAVVGWANPHQTFFGQVRIEDVPADQQEPLFWIGTTPEEEQDLAQFVARMRPWVVIPIAVLAHLCADRLHATPPTPLQQQGHALFRRVRQTE